MSLHVSTKFGLFPDHTATFDATTKIIPDTASEAHVRLYSRLRAVEEAQREGRNFWNFYRLDKYLNPGAVSETQLVAAKYNPTYFRKDTRFYGKEFKTLVPSRNTKTGYTTDVKPFFLRDISLAVIHDLRRILLSKTELPVFAYRDSECNFPWTQIYQKHMGVTTCPSALQVGQVQNYYLCHILEFMQVAEAIKDRRVYRAVMAILTRFQEFFGSSAFFSYAKFPCMNLEKIIPLLIVTPEGAPNTVFFSQEVLNRFPVLNKLLTEARTYADKAFPLSPEGVTTDDSRHNFFHTKIYPIIPRLLLLEMILDDVDGLHLPSQHFAVFELLYKEGYYSDLLEVNRTMLQNAFNALKYKVTSTSISSNSSSSSSSSNED